MHALFPLTRQIMKDNGRNFMEFTKIAVLVLNQIIRPFTARWHKVSVDKGFSEERTRRELRTELAALQSQLKKYTRMLADMAGVEDLTELETE